MCGSCETSTAASPRAHCTLGGLCPHRARQCRSVLRSMTPDLPPGYRRSRVGSVSTPIPERIYPAVSTTDRHDWHRLGYKGTAVLDSRSVDVPEPCDLLIHNAFVLTM